jgi:hypothetical protein
VCVVQQAIGMTDRLFLLSHFIGPFRQNNLHEKYQCTAGSARVTEWMGPKLLKKVVIFSFIFYRKWHVAAHIILQIRMWPK